jgi:hypothetical protein
MTLKVEAEFGPVCSFCSRQCLRHNDPVAVLVRQLPLDLLQLSLPTHYRSIHTFLDSFLAAHVTMSEEYAFSHPVARLIPMWSCLCSPPLTYLGFFVARISGKEKEKRRRMSHPSVRTKRPYKRGSLFVRPLPVSNDSNLGNQVPFCCLDHYSCFGEIVFLVQARSRRLQLVAYGKRLEKHTEVLSVRTNGSPQTLSSTKTNPRFCPCLCSSERV